MTYDPKLVDELLNIIDIHTGRMTSATTAFDAIVKVRETLRPAPPKPREWWVDDTMGVAFSTKFCNSLVHVREVMPDDKWG